MSRFSLPPVICGLTKQGHRFLSSVAVATVDEPSSVVGLVRKFVSSNSKPVALTTLSHLLSPFSTSHSRLSSIAFPLYSMIKQESWFNWNAKLVADLIAFLYKEERFEEAELLFTEAVLKLGRKERDLCMFYCNLVESHAGHRSERGVLDSWAELRQLILQSSSVYVKRRGYESVISGFCALGLPDKADILMEEMRGNGLKPSVFELRSLIYGYGQVGFLEDMKRIVVEMEEDGYELDTVCCNMVISSSGEHGELLDMLLCLRKMRNLGIPLSIRTYNSVLNSCPSIVLLMQDVKNLPLLIDELLDNLKTDERNLVQELLKSSILDQVMEWKPSELKLDLHGMHLSTAYVILLHWFAELRQRVAAGNLPTPTEVLLVCGHGRHSCTRGESPVKILAKELTRRTKCPLRIDRKNIGCFIAKGKVFKEWLMS